MDIREASHTDPDALADVAPDAIVHARRKGLRALRSTADRFPDAFIQNSVGTRFELASTPDAV